MVGVRCPICNLESDLRSDGKHVYIACEHVLVYDEDPDDRDDGKMLIAGQLYDKETGELLEG